MDLAPLPDLPDEPSRLILSICGGGFAGVFAAEFLRRLEADIGKPLADVFDLFCGTSIGGILALGLAVGRPASELSSLLEAGGTELFRLKGGLARRRGFFKPRHVSDPLREILKPILGDQVLADLKRKVLIPAVDITAGEAVIYSNARGTSPQGKTKLLDIALATSAAPMFLPAHTADTKLFADGGLVANSPEALAAVEAVHALCWPRERTDLLVVGSTQTLARIPGYADAGRWGGAQWAKDSRLLGLVMAAQTSLARTTALQVLGDSQVMVADVVLSAKEAAVVGLDKADVRAAQTLKTLAATAFTKFRADYPLPPPPLRAA